MKKYIIVTLLIIGSLSCFAINRLSIELEEKLSDTRINEKVEVTIILQDNFVPKITEKMSRKEKYHLMKDTAEDNRISFENTLERAQKDEIGNYDFFWIINGYTASASKETILQFSEREDVKFIELSKKMELIKEETKSVSNPSREIGWNLEMMNIPEVWDLGYTGEGVTIGIMDSGVTPNHPALADSWSGLWFDASGELATPNDFYGHGTHMTGVAVGGDGPGPFANDTGVAPNAQFAFAKISYNGFFAKNYMLDAYQWFASLIDEGVDIRIISCSIGTTWQSMSDWDALITLRQLDFIPIFAIGNSAGTTACPASYPTVFGVGATNQNDVRTDNSGQGPTPDNYPWNDSSFWERSDWNLIKPDICAPGVDIPTTEVGSGYCESTGTSPATPHIAGVAALMLQKNPTLTYNDVYNIMLDNAEQLGGTIPNNDYGWGRVDALAAVNAVPQLQQEYISQIGYDFSEIPNLGTTVEFYFGLKSYQFDTEGVVASISSENPNIEIQTNFSAFGDIPANTIVTNSEPFVFYVNESNEQGQIETFLIEIETNAGNTFVEEFTFTLGEPVLETVFFDDFEEGLDNWSAEEHWQIADDISYSPTHCVKNTYSNTSPGQMYYESLDLTEPIDFSNCLYKAELSFRLRFNLFSMDVGMFLLATANPDDEFATQSIAEFQSPVFNTEFTQIELDISQFAGEEAVSFNFLNTYFMDFDWYWAIDDFEIKMDQLGSPVSSEDIVVETSDFQLSNYPNPFNPSTTISFSITTKSTENTELMIYNLKGQQIKKLEIKNLKIGINEVIWDGTDKNRKPVSSGVYLYKLKNGRYTSSKKMILMK